MRTGTCLSQKQATIKVTNDGAVDRTIRYEVVHAPLSRPFRGLGYFHAKWHRDLEPLPEDRFPDWRILQATGRGRFCGVMLHVWNPRGGWWGEGDEKFFVDGEKFPSTIGTGSEDYFGYAWCHPGLFQYAFHCQTMTENNRGHQSVLRWHITDNIPFHTSFEACIEKYYPNSGGTLYACLPCFYQEPGQAGRNRAHAGRPTARLLCQTAAGRRRVPGDGPAAGKCRGTGHGRLARQVER